MQKMLNYNMKECEGYRICKKILNYNMKDSKQNQKDNMQDVCRKCRK